MFDKDLNLDPAGDWQWESSDVFRHLFDSLYQIGPEGEVRPALALDLPVASADGLTMKIRLREEASFHDDPCFPNNKGRRVVASDVVYTLKRVADPENKSGLWSLLKGKISGLDEFREGLGKKRGSFEDAVEGLRVLSADELEIELAKPFSQFHHVLAMYPFGIVPREAVEAYGDRFGSHPVGSGPFRLVSYSSKKILLQRVASHWRHPPQGTDEETGTIPEGIAYLHPDDPWDSFKRGELDIHLVDPSRLFAYVDSDFSLKKEVAEKGYSLHKIMAPGSRFLVFNFGEALLRNIHLRRSIAFGIDWKKLLGSDEVYSASLVPRGLAGYIPLEIVWDPARAREELALAGYPDGKGLPELVINYRWAIRGDLGAAGMIQDDLAALGIRSRLVHDPDDALKKGIHLGIRSWAIDYPDAGNILSLFHSANKPPEGNNYGEATFPEWDGLIEEAARTGDEKKRHDLYEEMNRWLLEQLPVIPYRQRDEYYALSPRLTRVASDPMGYFRISDILIRRDAADGDGRERSGSL